MEAGKLNHRVTIQRRASATDAVSGVVTEGWTEFAIVWAHIAPLSARDFAAADAVSSRVDGKITVRYLDGVTPSMRVANGDALYQIEGVLPDARSGREYLTLPVSRIVHG